MDIYCQHLGITYFHNQWNDHNEWTQVQSSMVHATKTFKPVVNGSSFDHKQYGSGTSTPAQQLYWDVKNWNFPAALGILELLSFLSIIGLKYKKKYFYCFFTSAPHIVNEALQVCTKPVTILCCLSNPSQELGSWYVACCLPSWLMLSDCSLVLPRWSICTHLLPFVF